MNKPSKSFGALWVGIVGMLVAVIAGDVFAVLLQRERDESMPWWIKIILQGYSSVPCRSGEPGMTRPFLDGAGDGVSFGSAWGGAC